MSLEQRKLVKALDRLKFKLGTQKAQITSLRVQLKASNKENIRLKNLVPIVFEGIHGKD